MARIFQKKEKKALNPYGHINDNLAFPLKEGLIIVLTRQSREEYYGNVSTDIQTKDMVVHAKELVVDPDKQVLLIDENLQADGSIKSVSGTWGTDKRKGLAQLYEAFANGYNGQKVALVLSFAEDRMFRDDSALEVNTYIKIALTYKVRTKIYQSGKIYDFRIPWDKKEFRAKCEWAADELNTKIIGRMLGARERMLERGEYSKLGSLAVGYTRDNDKTSKTYRKPIVYPPQTEIIKHLFNRYYDTGSAKLVYVEEVKGRYIFPPLEPGVFDFYGPEFTEKGAKLSHAGLRSILTNPFYIGWWFDRVNGVWIKDNHPAIVEPHIFWYAFKRLSSVNLDGTPNPDFIQGRERSSERKRALGALTGHLHPVHKEFHTHTRSWNKVTTYEVFSRDNPGERNVVFAISASELDRIFLGLLKEKLNDSKVLLTFKEYEEKAMAESEGKVTAREVELKAIEDQIAELEERVLRLTSKRLIDKVNAECERLEALKKETEERPVDQPNTKRRKRYDYYTLLEKIGPRLEKLTLEEKMIAVEATAEVYIEPLTRGFYKLVIDWYAWGKDAYIVQRRYGASATFSDEENEIIRRMYPTSKPEEIVALLPSKSWSAIKLRAFTMEVKREQYTKYKDKRIFKYSLDDIELMEENGIETGDRLVRIAIKESHFN